MLSDPSRDLQACRRGDLAAKPLAQEICRGGSTPLRAQGRGLRGRQGAWVQSCLSPVNPWIRLRATCHFGSLGPHLPIGKTGNYRPICRLLQSRVLKWGKPAASERYLLLLFVVSDAQSEQSCKKAVHASSCWRVNWASFPGTTSKHVLKALKLPLLAPGVPPWESNKQKLAQRFTQRDYSPQYYVY